MTRDGLRSRNVPQEIRGPSIIDHNRFNRRNGPIVVPDFFGKLGSEADGTIPLMIGSIHPKAQWAAYSLQNNISPFHREGRRRLQFELHAVHDAVDQVVTVRPGGGRLWHCHRDALVPVCLVELRWPPYMEAKRFLQCRRVTRHSIVRQEKTREYCCREL